MRESLNLTADDNNQIEVDQSSGLQQPEFRYIAIGRIVRAHGVRGEVSVAVLTDFPERFETTEWVYVGNEMEADAYRLKKSRWHKQNVLLTLDGVDNRTEAEQLVGLFIQVPVEETMPLPEGGYYLYQIMGLPVITTAGDTLGIISDVIETKANDVYIVKSADGTEILLPAIPDVIKSVDLDEGKVFVELLDGLI
ncbi:MAG: 16S rRNA processing protein RimM [Anaerolineae bacterium]|nr:16S rRNA processing protein RimM [Anaerolineae bacterium]